MLTIGKLGASTGVKVPTIRYYEQIGLLPEAERSAGNQRLYSQKALELLAFIRHARDLGFTLEAIRDLLSLSDQPGQPCGPCRQHRPGHTGSRNGSRSGSRPLCRASISTSSISRLDRRKPCASMYAERKCPS
mgnify:CR=1 FL=1